MSWSTAIRPATSPRRSPNKERQLLSQPTRTINVYHLTNELTKGARDQDEATSASNGRLSAVQILCIHAGWSYPALSAASVL